MAGKYEGFEDCNVCAMPFTSNIRKPITCFSCDYMICNQCIQRYILESKEKPHCMNCKKEWDMNFISSVTNPMFYDKKLRDHNADILIQEEKALLPGSQQAAQHYKRKIMLEEAKSNLLDKKKSINEQIFVLKQQANNITKDINVINKNIKNINRAIDHNIDNLDENAEIKDKSKYIMSCIKKDCNGYISTLFQCGTCNINICPDCYKELTTEEHKCNTDDINTVKMLKKNTKNCPVCKIPIFKIEGCDQMFCTSCHTPFSWITNMIVTGHIHNPHYYELQNQHGGFIRVHGDYPCGGLPNISIFQRKISYTNNRNILYSTSAKILLEYFRFSRYVQRSIIPTGDYPTPKYKAFEYNAGSYQNLRLQYINKLISEDKWKVELKKKHKQNMKSNDIYMIFDIYLRMSIEKFIEVVNTETVTEEYLTDINNQLQGLFDYCNQEFEKISRKYNDKNQIYIGKWFTFHEEIRNRIENSDYNNKIMKMTLLTPHILYKYNMSTPKYIKQTLMEIISITNYR